MKPTIYLSGTIGEISVPEATVWRRYIKITYSWALYRDPTDRYWDPDVMVPADIVEADKKDILESDLIFVYLTKYSPGTLMEIMFSYDNKKPIVLVNATNRAQLHPWIIYHTKIFSTIEQAMEYVLIESLTS